MEILHPIWTIISLVIRIVIFRIFCFFIDVEATNNRTEEEALAVVENGEYAANGQALNKSPDSWTDELIDKVAGGEFYERLFFDKRRERLVQLRAYFSAEPEVEATVGLSESYLSTHGLEPSLIERLVTEIQYRRAVFRWMILLGLLLIEPLNL